MSKEEMSLWEALKLHIANGNEVTIKVKHEGSGRGWIALAIIWLGFVAYEISKGL